MNMTITDTYLLIEQNRKMFDTTMPNRAVRGNGSLEMVEL
jgi:hypothetical protein